ncbi:ATP-binding protein [Candidatus Parcubacteria bacterium]|nr:ATP-binding protein [Candidatus Parcubacteria bacterium]
MKKVVLTGGPCGGKSTIAEALAREFGNKIIIVPEVATALFEAGFPPPNPWTQEWQDALQAAIISGQHKAESQAMTEAANNGAKAIICDRGILDGAAYLAGGVAEFCQRFRVDENNALSQYETVIHLESLSTLNPDLYMDLITTNPNRFEPLEQAQGRELNLRHAWAQHPKRIHLAGKLNKSAERTLEIVSQIF